MKIPESLWKAAVAVRDRLGPSDARRLVLGLLALRILDERPEAPAEGRWRAVLRTREPLRARAAWVEFDPELAEVLPPAVSLDPERLALVLQAVDDLPNPAQHQDPLGEVYMHLVGGFARSEGLRGGQYYSPPDIAALLADLVAPARGDVYDPACGSGGLLLATAGRAEAQVRLFGQEINPDTWRLARLSALVRGIPIELGPRPADTLREDLHGSLRADHVVANPPFNLARWRGPNAAEDPRWALGLAPDKNANLAWIQHALHHLSRSGTGAIVLANSSLDDRSKRNRDLRRALVRSRRIQGIVALPDRLFWTTNIPACIWLLGPSRGDQVLMLDARDLGELSEPGHRSLPAADRARIVEAVTRYRQGGHLDEPGWARSCPIDTLIEGEVRLNPGAHVPPPALPSPTARSWRAVAEELRHARHEAETLDRQLEQALSELIP
ncbi:MAG: hypothetical protein EA397_06110 [Deltaproteobacteria bacterium]|nr:MAG: hypothetical protein EA397_06110 [Deltaproteobacteria bacterium]